MKQCLIGFFVLSLLFSCKFGTEEGYTWIKMEVSATAYNSLAYQTNSNPHITAWGDSLIPGRKYIAVSRDLIKQGLVRDTPVLIDGFEGIYWVKDKMHPRWKNRIDIYMGVDVKKARQWGRRKVTIQYGVKMDDPTTTDTKPVAEN